MPTTPAAPSAAAIERGERLRAECAAHGDRLADRWTHHYNGPADFVARHGTIYEWSPPPRGYQPGAEKRCFGNCYSRAMRFPDRWLYVEGYADSVIFHHAWLVDRRTGKLYDPTWGRTPDVFAETPYLGVPIPFELLYQATLISGMQGAVLDDWEHNYPLLQATFDPDDVPATIRRLIELRVATARFAA